MNGAIDSTPKLFRNYMEIKKEHKKMFENFNAIIFPFFDYIEEVKEQIHDYTSTKEADGQ